MGISAGVPRLPQPICGVKKVGNPCYSPYTKQIFSGTIFDSLNQSKGRQPDFLQIFVIRTLIIVTDVVEAYGSYNTEHLEGVALDNLHLVLAVIWS